MFEIVIILTLKYLFLEWVSFNQWRRQHKMILQQWQYTQSLHLDETHLDAVKGLI